MVKHSHSHPRSLELALQSRGGGTRSKCSSTAEMEVESEPDLIPAGPKPIQRLDADVVNQIAAAEVSSVFRSLSTLSDSQA